MYEYADFGSASSGQKTSPSGSGMKPEASSGGMLVPQYSWGEFGSSPQASPWSKVAMAAAVNTANPNARMVVPSAIEMQRIVQGGRRLPPTRRQPYDAAPGAKVEISLSEAEQLVYRPLPRGPKRLGAERRIALPDPTSQVLEQL